MLRPFVDDQLRSILDSVSDGIWICDGAGIILDINAASERLNSMQAGDYLGKDVRCIVSQGIVDRSATLEVLETKRQASLIQHITKTGKQLLVTATPVRGANGRIELVSELAELSLLELSQKDIVAQSPQMQRTLPSLLELAQMDASRVLLLGESGTGKGLLAKFLHQVSPRSHKPFIQINCPAVPKNIFEAELFGYERGAFTGARENGKAGLIELAQGGTLFLDEVGDIPLTIQAKLPKYLDDYSLRRLGGSESHIVECRVAAATNCDLENLVERRLFRKDLYYRLNTFIVRIAPLREDIFGLPPPTTTSRYVREHHRQGARTRCPARPLCPQRPSQFLPLLRRIGHLVHFPLQDRLLPGRRRRGTRGGRGTIAGPVIGALVLRPLNEFTRIYLSDMLPGLHLVIFSLILILVMLYKPQGLTAPLSAYYNRPAANLTIADRKRLEIAKALATDPQPLLLDEVMAGLRSTEVDDMIAIIKGLRDQGVTVFVIEHIMRAVMALSDRVVVIHFGQKIAQGTPEEVTRDENVIKAYLGGEYGAA